MPSNNYILELPLDSKSFQLDILNKRFRIAEIIYNKLLSKALQRLKQLKRNKKYKYFLNLYINTSDPSLKKVYSKELMILRKTFKLTEYDLHAFGVLLQRKYKKNIDSNTMQKLASTAFNSIESNLYRKGKKVHFKKFNSLMSVEGKNNKAGIRFKNNSLEWFGLSIPIIFKETDFFAIETLKNPIKYCRIVRKPFNSGFRYFIQLIFSGIPSTKLKKDKTNRYEISPNKRVGIDIGTSTIAVVGEEAILLEELAPNINVYNKKIEKIQIKMNLSLKTLNPNKFNSDGTIKKLNKDKWIFSKNYLNLKWKLKNLYRKKSIYLKLSHNFLANKILSLGNEIFVETMHFNALSKRALKLERQTKLTIIKTKKNFKLIHKYKRKKRFGKSINNKAPAMLIEIINKKLIYLDKTINKINTKKFKASQYNHMTDSYIKKELKTRWNNLDGELIQRDLYSAFLIQNSCKSLESTNKNLCNKNYISFKEKHNKLIKELKENKVKNKNFGL